MSSSYSNIQPPHQTSKGMAIASLVLGVISIPTLGILGVGAITALVLGSIALKRVKKEPEVYGGRGMAIAGIITSVISLLLIAVFGILAAIAIPKLNQNLGRGREAGAIQALRTIHNSQAQYSAMRGRFGSLKELAELGLINQNYANGAAVSGYLYSSSGVSEQNYCVHAVRNSDSTATRDFVICEDGIIHFVESKTPGPVQRGQGVALNSPSYSR
jgi:type II secretory pathway pseudopilin PulG